MDSLAYFEMAQGSAFKSIGYMVRESGDDRLQIESHVMQKILKFEYLIEQDFKSVWPQR